MARSSQVSLRATENASASCSGRRSRPGIEPDERDRIFERFYRARSVRGRPVRGSGIGLSIVKHIARGPRGDVTVDSTPAEGSTFTVWCPLPPSSRRRRRAVEPPPERARA
jgi:signal transduction histidine kinase